MLKMSLNTGSVSTEKIAFQKENPGQSIELRWGNKKRNCNLGKLSLKLINIFMLNQIGPAYHSRPAKLNTKPR